MGAAESSAVESPLRLQSGHWWDQQPSESANREILSLSDLTQLLAGFGSSWAVRLWTSVPQACLLRLLLFPCHMGLIRGSSHVARKQEQP